jgi:pyruvate dehydrogenase E1 component beta subunit
MAGEVPLEAEATPIGLAAIARPGRDATISTHGHMTVVALKAAEVLAGEGLSCEVIDLRSLAPLDAAAVARSARRTGRLLTLEEGQAACGVGAEVAARVRELIGDVPTDRLGPLAAPVSSNPVLEAACIPGPADVAAAVRRLVRAQRQNAPISGSDREFA